MATKIYTYTKVKLIDGTEIEIPPLKIKYLREFMDVFSQMEKVDNDYDAIDVLVECVRISMQQYYPKISKNIDQIEDNLDMNTIYEILEYSAGVKINKNKQDSIKDQSQKTDGSDKTRGETWEELDLAKLESEVFTLGIWKNYEELELSLSMPELMQTIALKRELDYEEKKFLAAIQGVDIEKNNKSNAWEEMKARVFSKGQAANANDVLALQGANAQKAGFGIGMGLDYEDLR